MCKFTESVQRINYLNRLLNLDKVRVHKISFITHYLPRIMLTILFRNSANETTKSRRFQRIIFATAPPFFPRCKSAMQVYVVQINTADSSFEQIQYQYALLIQTCVYVSRVRRVRVKKIR